MSNGSFSVETSYLRELVEHLDKLTQHAVELCEKSEEHQRHISSHWQGEGHQGFKSSHDRWVRDAKNMRDDVDVLKKHLATAHNNYQIMLEHEANMWG